MEIHNSGWPTTDLQTWEKPLTLLCQNTFLICFVSPKGFPGQCIGCSSFSVCKLQGDCKTPIPADVVADHPAAVGLQANACSIKLPVCNTYSDHEMCSLLNVQQGHLWMSNLLVYDDSAPGDVIDYRNIFDCALTASVWLVNSALSIHGNNPGPLVHAGDASFYSVGAVSTVLPFEPEYGFGHPESCLFSLSKILFTGPK